MKMNLFYSCAIILSDKRYKGRENEKYNTEWSFIIQIFSLSGKKL